MRIIISTVDSEDSGVSLQVAYRHADSLPELRLLLLACVLARTTSSLLLMQLLEVEGLATVSKLRTQKSQNSKPIRSAVHYGNVF